MNKETAVALYRAAQEHPRCGAKWPCGSREEEAQAVCASLQLDEQGRTPEEAAACEMEWAAQKVRVAADTAAAAAAAEALIVKALADAKGDVKAYIRAFPEGASDSDIRRFDPTGNVVRGFRSKGIRTNRKGNYI